MPIDVFIDLSRVPIGFDVGAALRRLHAPESIGALARRVTVAVASQDGAAGDRASDGWSIMATSPVEACRDALAAAGEDARPLLVLMGDVRPSAAAVGSLLEAVDADPMFGFASARLTGADDRSIARLDVGGDREIDELPRRVLAEIPDTYLVADAPARCLLVKPVVGTEFREIDLRFRSVAGALWHYMSRARRCGFRTVICNRAVVDAPVQARPCPPSTITTRNLPEADRVLLRELCPDVEKTVVEFGTANAAAGETRLARALPQAYGARPSLLLDCRNIVAGVNGTTVAALGICRGLHKLAAEWDITLLSSQDASAFHALEASYPGWQIVTTLPARQFTVALRLSQPWHMQEMIDLHAAAAFNAYLFLDTIAWDAAYPAPRHLDGAWQFLADHADGIIFISQYTRDRFRHRFRVRDGMRELVAYLSFDPADYVHANARIACPAEEFIFVVGNDYDHKDVLPTVELLAAAFPYEAFVALGPPRSIRPRVRMLQSGKLSEAAIHRLYATARMVVFPSFYEGFGLPVLTTLAYGGTLVARGSALLDEIAARCAPRGRIVPFARRDELVTVVGQILHGEDVTTLPLGTAHDQGRPLSWQEIGGRILAFLTEMAADLSHSRSRAREHLLAQLMAAPTALTETGLKRPGVHAPPSETA
jgi:glycosyltransferase involved in cell wall biosynthesis